MRDWYLTGRAIADATYDALYALDPHFEFHFPSCFLFRLVFIFVYVSAVPADLVATRRTASHRLAFLLCFPLIRRRRFYF